MLAKTEKVNFSSVASKPDVLVFPVITVVVIIALSIFVVIPTIKSIIEKRDQAKQEQIRLEKLIAKREALENLSAADMTRELEILNQTLPSRKPIVGIMGAIIGVATESGVTLKGYEFNPGYVASEAADTSSKEKPGVLSTLVVSLGMSGKYEEVVNYFRKIQLASPLSKYLTASLKGAISNKESQSDFTADMQLEVYYAAPPDFKGKITDPLPPMSPKKEEIIQRVLSYTNYSINPVETDTSVQLVKPNPFNY